MKIELKLLKAKTETPEGFPLVFEFSHKGKRKQKTVGFSAEKHFSADTKMITSKHPDHDILAPRIMELKLKARKIVLSGCEDIEQAFADFFKPSASEVTFMEYYSTLLEQMKLMSAQFGKNGNVRSREKMNGNIRVYENVMAQFGSFVGNMSLAELDFPTLLRFKNYQLSLGNSKSTVHQYLRTVRAIYNKGLLFHKLPNPKPFSGIFSGLATKSYGSRKKHLTKDAVRLLERLDVPPGSRKFIDLFLLQFYFGGADLKDLYYLEKKQVRKGRVYFERSKTDTGFMIDIKVHPKAEAIIARYPADDQWLFPWRKDSAGYMSFRRRMQRVLVEIQEKQNALADEKKDETLKIELAADGNLGIKVARHTFANIGKQLMTDPEILAELMGHVENTVANFYKDKHAEKVRDEALFRIIE